MSNPNQDKGILENVKESLVENYEAAKEKISEYAEAAKEAVFGHTEGGSSGGSGEKVLGLPIEKTVEENLKEEQEADKSGRIIIDRSEQELRNESKKITGQNFQL